MKNRTTEGNQGPVGWPWALRRAWRPFRRARPRAGHGGRREAQGLTHPSRRPSTDRQHACGAVRHARSVPVSVRREAHRHGNHPDPGGPHLAAVHRPLGFQASASGPGPPWGGGLLGLEVWSMVRRGRVSERTLRAAVPRIRWGPRCGLAQPQPPIPTGVSWAAASSPSAWTA